MRRASEAAAGVAGSDGSGIAATGFHSMLTLALAVMLPAAALICVNVYHLKSIERDKVLEKRNPPRLPADARHLREADQSQGVHDRRRAP